MKTGQEKGISSAGVAFLQLQVIVSAKPQCRTDALLLLSAGTASSLRQVMLLMSYTRLALHHAARSHW